MKHPRRWLAGVGGAVVLVAGAGATVACTCDTPNFGSGPEITHTFSCYGPATSGCWTPNACTATAETSDTTDLQAKIDAADAGDTVCGAGTYGAITILDVDNSSNVTLQSTDPDDAMTIDPFSIEESEHWMFQGIHFEDVEANANRDVTFRHNLHTHGRMLIAPTTNCNPPEEADYVEDGNILVSHSEFTDFNTDSGGVEGRLTVCGGGDDTHLNGIVISDNWIHKGWKAVGESSCSDGIGAYGGTNYGLVIEYNEFSDMAQGACVTDFPLVEPHVDPIAPSGMDFSTIRGNYFHDMVDGSGGILAGPTDSILVENNVFDQTVYPWSIVAFSTHDWQARHNTFTNFGRFFLEANSGNPCPTDNNVQDNSWSPLVDGLYTPQDPTPCAWSLNTNSYNLNSGKSGTGEITGTPVYIGGVSPTTYCGFEADPTSPSYHAGSDGSSMGINPPDSVCS